MWPAGTEGSRSHSCDKAATALPAPAQLSLRKGELKQEEGQEKLPAKPPPCTAKEPPGMGTGFWCVDSPGSWKTEWKREKPTESIKGWGVL
jgi:hypothetical protein